MNYVLYQPSTGEIFGGGSCSEDDFEHQPRLGCEAMEGEGSALTHYVRGGELVEYTSQQAEAKATPHAFYMRWSNELMAYVDARSPEQINAAEADGVRHQRDRLLANSDWTDTLSFKSRVGDTVYQAWQDYRQALRDITEQPGFPLNVTWPQAPE